MAKKTTEDKMAKAVSDSWKDKKVASARNTKHKVRVSGKEYNSVFAAFNDLKLDTKRHGKFRKELKAAGAAVYKEGKRALKFSVVER